MTRRLTLALFAALSGALLTTAVDAQARLISSMSSPRATVSQVVGVTDIHVDYGRPGVKGRTIMGNGQIVAYDAVQPWRAGANENTVVRFKNGGRDLRARQASDNDVGGLRKVLG